VAPSFFRGAGAYGATVSLLTARGVPVCVEVSGDGARLLRPRYAELSFLWRGGEGGAGGEAPPAPAEDASAAGLAPLEAPPGGAPAGAPTLPPGQLLALLYAAGINVRPVDEDAPSMALLCAAEESPAPPPPLGARVEGALSLDVARAAAAWAVGGVGGAARGWVAGAPPADPTDAPPNAGAHTLAQLNALEVLGAGEARAPWAAHATSTRRLAVVGDPGVPRGFKVGVRAEPEALAPGAVAPADAPAPFAALDDALLAGAVPEAALRVQRAPPAFTDALLRTLLLMRPIAFGR
jgi:hypothetical protein